MVAQLTLTQLVGVRTPVSQPLSTMKKLIVALSALLLGGCVYVPQGHPYVRYYRTLQPQYIHHEVIPIRTENYIGYQDHRGNIHLWPAR